MQPNGETTLPLNLKENNAGKTEIDANIFIDVCDKIRRIIVVERGQPAATQEPGCERRDIAGLYWVRQVNTLVVDVGGPNPTMMLVKGSYDPGKARNWSLAPTGLHRVRRCRSRGLSRLCADLVRQCRRRAMATRPG